MLNNMAAKGNNHQSPIDINTQQVDNVQLRQAARPRRAKPQLILGSVNICFDGSGNFDNSQCQLYFDGNNASNVLAYADGVYAMANSGYLFPSGGTAGLWEMECVGTVNRASAGFGHPISGGGTYPLYRPVRRWTKQTSITPTWAMPKFGLQYFNALSSTVFVVQPMQTATAPCRTVINGTTYNDTILMSNNYTAVSATTGTFWAWNLGTMNGINAVPDWQALTTRPGCNLAIGTGTSTGTINCNLEFGEPGTIYLRTWGGYSGVIASQGSGNTWYYDYLWTFTGGASSATAVSEGGMDEVISGTTYATMNYTHPNVATTYPTVTLNTNISNNGTNSISISGILNPGNSSAGSIVGWNIAVRGGI